MLIHTWVTDTILDEQKIPSCGMYLWFYALVFIVLLLAGFILGTPHHIYHLLATSEDEKKSWFTILHKMIFVQKQLFCKVR